MNNTSEILLFVNEIMEDGDFKFWAISALVCTFVLIMLFLAWKRMHWLKHNLYKVSSYAKNMVVSVKDQWELLKDDYENKRLYTPEEYYDELIWSTIVGGWSGSLQVTAAPQTPINAVEDFFNGIADWFGNLSFAGIMAVIVIVIVILIGLYMFIKIGLPLLLKRSAKKRLGRR